MTNTQYEVLFKHTLNMKFQYNDYYPIELVIKMSCAAALVTETPKYSDKHDLQHLALRNVE